MVRMAVSILTLMLATSSVVRINCFRHQRLQFNAQFTRLMSGASGSQAKRQRIERIISNRGVGSRKEVQKLLKQGRVKVNGKLVRSSSEQFPSDCVVEVDEEEIVAVPLLALYHKPVGVVSTMNDGKWGRESLQQLQEDFPFLKTMHPVGRLDMDTSGLLLFSSNGQLTNALLHPNTGVEREYEAIVAHEVENDSLAKVLEAGVKTTLGEFSARLLESKALEQRVSIPKSLLAQNEDDDNLDKEGREVRTSIDDGGDEEEEVGCSYVRVMVKEGKYRMVRRILHNAGHSVINLHRVRYGNIVLDEELEEGGVIPCSVDHSQWARTLGSFKQ